MASSATNTDYFNQTRPAIRTRPPSSGGPSTTTNAAPTTPTVNSPRTPLFGRSISSQFGSPGASFRQEQEEQIIYELGSRHLSAGFAGESRPRCIHLFSREDRRRVGDYRAAQAGYRPKRKKRRIQQDEETETWSEADDVELYRNDIRALDLGLVEDKFERVLRMVHTDYLQLDSKPRKAVLVVPSLLPTPLVEIVLKVLFQHYAQPPSVVLLTTPLLACVGAGLRNALVVDIGWQETIVTAVSEYKEVASRRSIRAGRRIVREMAQLLGEELRNQLESGDDSDVTLAYAEEVVSRVGWCKPKPGSSTPTVADIQLTGMIKLPTPTPDDQKHIHIALTRLSKPAEIALFPQASATRLDDHDHVISLLLYDTLLALPMDLRSLCLARIVFTGGLSNLSGVKARILYELEDLISNRGWDVVADFGSASKHHARILHERSTNISSIQQRERDNPPDVKFSADKKLLQDSVPHHERVHDDLQDIVTKKVETEMRKGKPSAEIGEVKAAVRGVETVGAWAGASIMASLKVKGVHEVERDDFLKHGLRDEGGAVI